MKGKELFKILSEKAGIAADDKDLVTFLAANENIEIPDSLASAFQAKLMNESEAKLNPALKGHFTHLPLKSIDEKINGYISDAQFDDNFRSKIAGEKNTYEKVILLANEIQALERAKVGATKGDKEALTKEIERLNSEFTKISDKHKAEIKSLQEQSAREIQDFAIDGYLASMNYANKDIPKEANIATARYLLEKQLKEKGINISRDGKELRLLRADDTSLPYTENHKPVTFQALVDSVLSTNKLLQVGNPQPSSPKPQFNQPQQQQFANPELESHYASQLAEFSSNGHN